MTFLKYTSGFINLIDRRKADGNINIEAIFVEPKDYLVLWEMYMGFDTYVGTHPEEFIKRVFGFVSIIGTAASAATAMMFDMILEKTCQ